MKYSLHPISNYIVSPRKSANNPAADFHGITDNFHNVLPNLLPDVRGLHNSKVFTSPRMSAAGLFTEYRGLKRTAKSPRKCRVLSRTVLVRDRPFAERDFSLVFYMKFGYLEK